LRAWRTVVVLVAAVLEDKEENKEKKRAETRRRVSSDGAIFGVSVERGWLREVHVERVYKGVGGKLR